MRSPKLMDADKTALMVVDIQDKLVAAMDEASLARLVDNARRMIQTAQALSVPILVTEQYPKGLGATIPPIWCYQPRSS